MGSIPELMDELGVSRLESDTERRSYLHSLTSEQLLGDIALVSSFARGVSPDENTPLPSQKIIVFENDNRIESSTGIRYIPPRRDIGQAALADSLEIAKQHPDLRASGALLRLMIPLAHIQMDGNGAASRFYGNILTHGYDRTALDNQRYDTLLSSRAGQAQPHYSELKWDAAFAEYHADQVSKHRKLPFTPAGFSVARWQSDQLAKYPALEHGQGIYFVEDHFATAVDVDFLAETGRNIKNYTFGLRQKWRKHMYFDTEKLLSDVGVEESSLAQDLGDQHKTAYLTAVNNHFYSDNHPAFKGLDQFAAAKQNTAA